MKQSMQRTKDNVQRRKKKVRRKKIAQNRANSAKVKKTAVTREYKSRMFAMIFKQKGELLELYNAVSGRNYKDPETLVITTLENAVYLSMKNDVSFLIDFRLSLYEHQSTYNPNMPLRFLLYLADLYSVLINRENYYGRKAIQIPAPRFVIFYNGVEVRPDYEVLRLSDLYAIPEEKPFLELKAEVFNINVGHNRKLLNACKSLGEYAEYVHRVRSYLKELPIEEAVERAITECIREGILRDFLERNRAEAKAMSIYEYDEEAHLMMEREDAYADGHREGCAQTRRIFQLYMAGKTAAEIASACNFSEEYVRGILS